MGPIRLQIPVDRELAEALADVYNSYAAYMEGFACLDGETVLRLLQETMDAEDIEHLMEDDFGKGLIMGQVHAVYVMQQALEDADEYDS